MAEVIEIGSGIHWIGARDPELRVFDDLFPTENGTTYNSYLVKGAEKIAIIDTVKGKRAEEFLGKVKSLVDPARVDYIVVNHAEPDHSGSLAFLLQHCPNAVVVSTQAARTFLGNMTHMQFNAHVIKDGETIDLGGRRLKFIVAPFLHWPDTMFTLLEEDGVLFSCDAFGSHFCGDSMFNDENPDFSADTRFYFDCIMRPFKDKILSAVAKVRGERISVICPSHGPILRSNPMKTVDQYEAWSKLPEQGKKVSIFYISPHGNTELMSAAVAKGAAIAGVEVSCHHINHISLDEVRDIMENSHGIIFGTPTINRDVPKPMWEVLALLSTVRPTATVGGIFGSYGWSGEACKMVEDRLKGVNMKLPVPPVRCPFKPRPETLAECEALGRAVAEEVIKK